MKYWNPSCECMSRDEMTVKTLSPETLKRWMT